MLEDVKRKKSELNEPPSGILGDKQGLIVVLYKEKVSCVVLHDWQWLRDS